jgi:hypothetical protein
VATPADWKQGGDVIIAGSVTDEDARKTYPNGWKSPKPYIRSSPSPAASQDSSRFAKKRARGLVARPFFLGAPILPSPAILLLCQYKHKLHCGELVGYRRKGERHAFVRQHVACSMGRCIARMAIVGER